MTVTADYVLALDAWVGRAADGKEREARIAKVRETIFPVGLDKAEVAKREAMVALAKEAADPMPLPVAPTVPLMAPWEGLVSRNSKAYRRGTTHDGLGREVERYRDEARGNPFAVDAGRRR